MASLGDYCKTCGMCCKYAFILPEERESVARRAGFLKRRFIKKEGGHYVIDTNPCMFLKNGLCSIEVVKPIGCKVFPMVLSRGEGKPGWTISGECPLCNRIPDDFREKAVTEGGRLLDFHSRQ
jgi:Fe-S-cluster containining protein